ncbi:MAG TPA: hypothetical protein PKE00_03625 [Planctomycetota bacterium]|nr:hypothetical protein [Planctomycetota bacterium]
MTSRCRFTRVLVGAALAAIALLAACRSHEVARYDTAGGAIQRGSATAPRDASKLEERLSGQRAARRDAFGTYDDEAAARHLDLEVANALALQIEERDREARRLEAEVEIERMRSEAWRAQWEAGLPARRPQSSPFPINTLFYGGLGAVIGHQYGRRDRGLAIGAGLGLLHDVLRFRW